MRTGRSEEVLELVLAGEAQIGLVRALRHPAIEVTPFYQEELVLACAPGHPFAADGTVRIEQLGGEALILFDRASSYHELTGALFRSAGVVPRGVMELDNIDAAKQMVRRGLGVALLPHTAVAGRSRRRRARRGHRDRRARRAPPDRRDPPPRRRRAEPARGRVPGRPARGDAARASRLASRLR